MEYANITADFVLRARCPRGRKVVEFKDLSFSGLVLQVRRRGGLTFFFDYIDARDMRRRHRIGSYPNISAESARREADQLMEAIDDGFFPLEPPNLGTITPAQRDALDRARMIVADAVGGCASWIEFKHRDEFIEFDDSQRAQGGD
jgi:hypothetical protein